jgi:uncharacterized protein involved in exopolysaccharide biosynthesis
MTELIEPVQDRSKNEFSLMELFQVVWKRKWLVFWTTIGITLVGVGLALVWPKSYEASATVFPVSNSGGSSMSDYAGLASLAGVTLPTSATGNNAGKTVNALLASRLLVETLVREEKLTDVLPNKGKSPEEKERLLVESLRHALSTKEDSKTGVITVTFELGDPQLAQQITNQVLDVLDELLSNKSLSANQKKREQLTRQVEEQSKKVETYQRQMAEFQKETTLLNPTAQAGKAVDAYTALVQQRMSLELQLATAQASYSPDNPRITLLQTQLTNLESQIQAVKNQVGGDLPSIKSAPDAMIRYQNLARDLEIATKIYAGLLASLEQSNLDSQKDQVFIEVLDRALLPTVGKPNRTLIVLASTVLGIIFGVVLCFVSHVFFGGPRFPLRGAPLKTAQPDTGRG